MREQYMRHGEGFVICYSITDRRSFDEVLNHKNLIDRVRCKENIPIIITGNKCDLEHKRKVSLVSIFMCYKMKQCSIENEETNL
jgi:GTPase SAR1 family protein